MRVVLRDAAVGYASRGIPVLPLHYPITRPQAPRPLAAGQPGRSGWSTGCSCRDVACGQVAKHPLGALVPHGLTEATTNRARVLAWWTRFPQANIGLACGQRFDVLDLDGPQAVAALQSFADRHGLELPASGPVARTGREQAGWHYYLAPAGLGRRSGVLERVDYQGRGAYVVVPPSRHASGQPYRWVRDLDHPLPQLPEGLRAELERPSARPAAPMLVGLPPAGGPGPAYVRSALAASPRPARSASTTPANLPALTALQRLPRPPASSGMASSGSRRGGDGHGRRRPAGRLRSCSRGGRVPPPSRARAHPNHPQEGACMGSPPTLDPTPNRLPDLDQPEEDHHLQARHPELLEHLQTPAALGGHEFQDWPPHQIAGGFGGDLDARHRHDHTRLASDFTHTHPELHRDPVREAEGAFDRLNPEFAVPADQRSHYGHQAVREREAALALGVRVAVHDSRQNDRNPVIWQPGQDYRMADAIQAARTQPTRTCWGPERVGPER